MLFRLIRRAQPLLAVAILAEALPASSHRPLTNDQVAWLSAHNEARRDFGSPALEWSDELASDAQEWAVRLARARRLQHAGINVRRDQGENLWMGTQGRFAPQRMVASFVKERRFFRAGPFPELSSTGRWSDVGHYTQVVWPETREVGCALASGANKDVLVCRYWPAGNVNGVNLQPRMQLSKR